MIENKQLLDYLKGVRDGEITPETVLDIITNTTEMGLERLISSQYLQIEHYKKVIEQNKKLKKQLMGMFYNIGAPLNDNILMFNKDQHKWCFEVVALIEDLNLVE